MEFTYTEPNDQTLIAVEALMRGWAVQARGDKLVLQKNGDRLIVTLIDDALAAVDLFVDREHMLTVAADDVELIFALHDGTEDDLWPVIDIWLAEYGRPQ
jgi:hypothetical protein